MGKASAVPVVDAPITVRRIWIEEGCIACGWCGDLLPTVFHKGVDGGSQIHGKVRKDQTTDDNRATLSPLRRVITGEEADFLSFVAAGCPPHVIRLE